MSLGHPVGDVDEGKKMRRVYLYTHVCAWECASVGEGVCVCACVYQCACVCACSMCANECVCVCVCVYACV